MRNLCLTNISKRNITNIMKTTISEIASRTGISQGFLSNIICGRRKPHWKTAKKLAFATNTSPILWVEGSPEEIKRALSKNQEAA